MSLEVVETCHEREYSHPSYTKARNGKRWMEELLVKIVRVRGDFNEEEVDGWYYMTGGNLGCPVDFCFVCGRKLD